MKWWNLGSQAALILCFATLSFLHAQAPRGLQTPKGNKVQEPPDAKQAVAADGSPATNDLREQLDRVQASINDLSKKLEETRSWSSKDVSSLLVALVAIGSLILSIYSLYENRKMNMRTLRQKAWEEERTALQKKLDEFYGPLVQLRGTSKLLYEAFRSRQPNPDQFRTLTALLAGKKFEGNDKGLLEEIIKIGEETENLILKSSGLVDEDLQEVLWKATAHFRVLRLAHQGQLRGEEDNFRHYVFPRELDQDIQTKLQQLRARLDQLRTVT